MRNLHLGDLLVKNGVLTAAQRDEILLAQQSRGGPFGVIAEEMFGVSPQAVEDAWAEQYSHFAPHVDPRLSNVAANAVDTISRRQAWQFRILPLEFEGDNLILCTTREALVRALKFAGWRLGHSCQFVLAEPIALGEAMERLYPLPGMKARMMCEPIRA